MASSTSSSDPVAEPPAPLQAAPQWMPGLEMLRGIAAISVVFHHLWSLGSQSRFAGSWIIEGFGSWGVDIFFVLSAYLLIGPFLTEPTGPRVRSYAVRRIFRVVPAYWLSVIVLFLFFAQPGQVYSAQGLRQLVGNLTFTFWWQPEQSSSLNVNGVYWTLSIEMALYAAIPLVGWCMRRRPLLTVGALALAGIGWKLVVARSPETVRGWFFDGLGPGPGIEAIFMSRQFPGILTVFATGFAARWVVEQRPQIRERLAGFGRFPMVTLGVLLVPSILWLRTIETGLDFRHWRWFAAWDAVLALLAVPAIVVLSSLRFEGAPSVVQRACEWLGLRSYGIYLWHFPIVLSVYGRTSAMLPPVTDDIVVRVALVLGLALLFGAASFRLVEQPAQARGKQLARRVDGLRRAPA